MGGRVDLQNPWLYVFTRVILWIVVWSTLQVVLLNGDLRTGIIQGAIGGLGFGILMLYLRQRGQ